VVTLPSGLQYKILVPGGGLSPKSNDTVVINYRGSLIDGTVFDDSTKRNEGKPTTIQMDRVRIPEGWREALQLMKPGAKWQLAMPFQLAYGENGRPPAVGPKATVLFEFELISSTPPPPAPPAAAVPPQSVTSDIIKVPSAEEIKKGAKAEIIKADQIDKEIEKEKAKPK